MYFQFVLASFIFVNIIKSEVVDKHFSKCQSFFYKDSPPRGFSEDGVSAICQRHRNSHHYATLYSSRERIPMYSAYTLDILGCPSDQPNRRSKWFIEPQLSGRGRPKDMTTEGSLTNVYMHDQAVNIDYPNTNYDRGHLNPNFYQCNDGRTATFTLTNAVPQDPCFNQQIWKDMEKMSKNIMTTRCNFPGAKRYFLTGAVPSGKKIPSVIHDKEGDEPRAYNRVSVPSVMWTAACCDSSKALHSQDKNKGFSFGYYGDNIPDSYIIPYGISNLEDKLASKYGIHTLELFADSCYSNTETSKTVQAELAVPVERKIAEHLANMAKSSESSLPPAKRRFVESVNANLHENEKVARKNWRFADADFGLCDKRSDIQGTRNLLSGFGMTTVLIYPNFAKAEASQSDNLYVSSSKSRFYTSFEERMSQKVFESQQFNRKGEIRKKTSLLDKDAENDTSEEHSSLSDTNVENYITEEYSSVSDTDVENDISDEFKSLSDTDVENDKSDESLSQMDLEYGISDEYIVVPSQESALSASGSRCRQGHSCNYYDKAYKWCYIDWSNNWDYCCIGACGFEQKTSYAWCYSGHGKRWAYCSQRSSMITVPGKPCRADHECGTHGESYHWCYTDTKNNWEYCCQPWHECAKHGSSYKWCYVGYKKKSKWKKCYY